MRVLSDFDGTISLVDTTDAVLREFADPAWEAIEAQWVAGEITASACMQSQISLIRAPLRSLDRFLDTIEIDPGFAAFVDLCKRESIPLSIVSDGVDYFIKRILTRNGLGDLPVVANRLVRQPDGGWKLLAVTDASRCIAGSGVCKCNVLSQSAAGPVVYIGDGRSDFCVSGRADVLFAKSALAAHSVDNEMAFVRFETFADIAHSLTQTLREAAAARRASHSSSIRPGESAHA